MPLHEVVYMGPIHKGRGYLQAWFELHSGLFCVLLASIVEARTMSVQPVADNGLHP